MSIRDFGKKSNKNMNLAPLIITKGGKKSFIILPYEMADKVFNQEPTTGIQDFAVHAPFRHAPVNINVGVRSFSLKPSFKTWVKKLLLTKLF